MGLDQIRVTAGDRGAEVNRRTAVPNRTAGREPFISAMDDAIDLWTRVDGQPGSALFTPPLLLMSSLYWPRFAALRASVDVAITIRPGTERAVAETRLTRNAQQDRAYSLMKQ